MSSNFPPNHPPIAYGKIGVLLINLGTPDATDYWSIRRYLKEFLSDTRVIEVPRLLWMLILNLFILTFRPRKTARAYKKIWMTETNESPLRYYTRAQAQLLKERLPEQMHVEWAMRYGNPSIASKLQQLKELGCDRILVCALYPQYSASTTASVYDEVFRALQKMRWQPSLRTLPPYHDHPLYIQALANSIQDFEKSQSTPPEQLLVSFHGLPKSYFEKGDPYHCHCHKTTRLLKEALPDQADRIQLCFQSRFGPEEWLQPYTDETLMELGKAGSQHVAVITPGFSADCVETLEEIAIQGEEQFQEAGGKSLSLIPCLNEQSSHIDLLESLVRRELQGWLGPS